MSVTVNQKIRRERLKIVTFFICFWVLLLISRLFYLQINKSISWETRATKQQKSYVKVAPERGMIFDRKLRPLAVSVPSKSVYVRPSNIIDKSFAAESLARVLKLEKEYVNKKLASKSPFVWLKRQIPEVLAKKALDLKIKGVNYVTEPKRYYPYKKAASTFIGKVGIDGNGLSGLELNKDKFLTGEERKADFYRDANGRSLRFEGVGEDAFSVSKGNSLTLTIDAEIQSIVDEELEKAYKKYNAKSVFAGMLNARTGEILALSQAPGINFNKPLKVGHKFTGNQLIESVFEPGSIFKPIVAAVALELGFVNHNELFDCENGSFKFGRRRIRDVHPNDFLTLEDIVIRSSNIGMSKIGMRLGKRVLHNSIREFGFGEKINFGLPGETPGILRKYQKWADIDVATHSFGQGLAVTGLQLLRSYAVLVNGGLMPEVQIFKKSNIRDMPRKRVISENIANYMRNVLVKVVEDEHGTGSNAKIENIVIGGKTGTAQKAMENGKGYKKDKYISSFMGFADAKSFGLEDEIVLLVSVDEANTDSIYGGTLAAPVFKQIIERSLGLLTSKLESEQEEVLDSGFRLASLEF